MTSGRGAKALVLFVLFMMSSSDVLSDFVQPPVNLFSRASYDYAPAVIQEGTTQRFWWCGFGEELQTDVILYRSVNVATGEWTAIQTVLAPSPTAWDSRFVCDPTVVRGAFTNPQDSATYSYALYYTATDQQDGKNNRIGLAFSHDGINWIKYSQPVVSPQELATTTYGAGQASAYNADGASSVYLFFFGVFGESSG